ncbi:hypothetical protein GCM10025864_26820 [Luteimicrobium album]|uniref:Uncharacterized protein n=1 Tax=Luteimicrobium album TaxID=1054550 RepID=A0ABQ6I4M3_9MICO|nr:hypothetical protein [Luteimicrobium album]GMA24923.1 hypothetical protein GCM10025864_26820 [Luteimicrobium album]
MSTTVPLPAPAPAPASVALHALVADYARGVRAELDDLPADTVDDLTDGLEADLLDALADTPAGLFRPDDGPRPGADLTDTVVAPPAGGAASWGAPGTGAAPSSDVPFTAATLTTRFGTPAAYAAELRSSAGLAPRVAAQGAATRRGVGAAWAETRAGWAQRWRELKGAPGWRPVFEFLEVLRPVWWVGRAWVLVTALLWTQRPVALLPENLLGWVLLLAAVVCSVQWGRGAWRLPHRWEWVGRLVGVTAVVLLVPTFATAYSEGSTSPYDDASSYEQGVSDASPTNGVWVDGQEAENLYVYGADGKLVDGARVYDDTGKPVLVADPQDLGTLNDDDGQGWFEVPSLDRSGRQLWNAYPLERAQIAVDEDGNAQYDDQGMPLPQTGVAPTAPVAPFDQVSPLTSRAAVPAGEARPGDGTTPSPVPSDAASPAPSSDATPTPEPTKPAK